MGRHLPKKRVTQQILYMNSITEKFKKRKLGSENDILYGGGYANDFKGDESEDNDAGCGENDHDNGENDSPEKKSKK